MKKVKSEKMKKWLRKWYKGKYKKVKKEKKIKRLAALAWKKDDKKVWCGSMKKDGEKAS